MRIRMIWGCCVLRKFLVYLVFLLLVCVVVGYDYESEVLTYVPYDINLTAIRGAYSMSTGGDPTVDTTTKKVGAGSVDCDGNDVVNMGDVDVNTSFSVSVWVYASAGSTGTVVGKAQDNAGYRIYLSGGQVRWSIFASSGACDIYSGTGIPGNTWTHIVGMNNATACALWVNGRLNNTAAPRAQDSNNYQTMTCADPGGGGGPGLYLTGKVDEVGVWDNALSRADVEELYNSGVGLNPFEVAGADPCDPPDSAGTWFVPGGCNISNADFSHHLSTFGEVHLLAGDGPIRLV